jgi:hypothetical protein
LLLSSRLLLPQPLRGRLRYLVSHVHHPEIPNSPESDFGAFVSVDPSEDPLSPFSGFSPSISPVISTRLPEYARSSTRQGACHPSLTFFDKFTSDAKRASEVNRRGYLEELLLHTLLGKDLGADHGHEDLNVIDDASSDLPPREDTDGVVLEDLVINDKWQGPDEEPLSEEDLLGSELDPVPLTTVYVGPRLLGRL